MMEPDWIEDNEWWKSASQETYRELRKKLINKFGWAKDEADEFLSRAHQATAAEYGD